MKRHKKQKVVDRRWTLFGQSFWLQTEPRCLTLRFYWGQWTGGVKQRFYTKVVR